MQVEDNLRRGMSPDEARRQALPWLEHVIQDLGYALRGLRARPLFAVVVVATLGLGVGVNAAMFGILDRTLFRPPRYLVDPGTVHRVYIDRTGSDGRRMLERRLEYTRYADLVRLNRFLSRLAAFTYRDIAVGEGEDTRELPIAVVTATFFDFFDAKPVLGRFFRPQEDAPPTGDAVAVLSFGYWQSRYGERQDILGSTLKIGPGTYTIIGVAPRGFDGVSDQRTPVAFVPATTYAASLGRPTYYTRYSWSWLEILVRRQPGVSANAATADLTNAFRASWQAEGAPEAARPIALAGPVQLARGPMAGPEAKVVGWIGGVGLVVLLIACANVANLLLARGLRRRREIVVRRALGGTPGRLVQQLLTETLVLAVLGTAAGLFGAQLAAGSLRALLLASGDPWPVVTDGRTIAFAVTLTLVTAVLAGLLPALHAGRGDLAGSLRAGARDGAYRQSPVRMTLLLVQSALSVVLLVGAGLFLRSLQQVRALPLGYDVDPLVYLETAMRGVRLNPAEGAALADRLTMEARAIPGVAGATLAISVPFLGGERQGIHVAGIDSVQRLGQFQLQAGSPEYFATLGTRILRGRGLSADDRAGTPLVGVVSEAMAKALWKDENPIGKCFRIRSETMPCTTVVGVAENIRARSLSADGEFMYYLPISQYVTLPFVAARPQPLEGISLLVRVQGDPAQYLQPLRSRLQRLMPGSSYITAVPFHQIVDPAKQSWTSGAQMFSAFGALALTLAGIGLYAVLAFAVAQRTQELGVRIALGARAGDVLRLVVGEGVRVTIGGVVIGIAIAVVAANAIGGLLFRVSPRDPLVYGIVAATLIVVGILASAIPAARAARVDPNVALRTD